MSTINKTTLHYPLGCYSHLHKGRGEEVLIAVFEISLRLSWTTPPQPGPTPSTQTPSSWSPRSDAVGVPSNATAHSKGVEGGCEGVRSAILILY